MKLDDSDLKALAKLSVIAAREAGLLISEYANRDVEVLHKEGGDSLASQVVTEVDEKAQAVILGVLQESVERYDLAVLTEESEDDGSRHKKDYFWCIDPMDGTLPFTRRKPGYSVSIALLRSDGTPLIGTVFDPVENRLYEATQGQGVKIDGQSWTLPGRKPRASDCLKFYCDCTFEDDPERQSTTSKMLDLAKQQGYGHAEVILGGGAVLNACEVLTNSPAVYFKKPKPKLGGGCSWDFAASSCLFIESGASVSDFWGQPLDLNDAEHPYFNHCGVCFTTEPSLVAPIGEYFGGHE